MSETPRDQRGLWSEVNARIGELGEVLRGHLSPDAARTPTDPTAPSGSPGPAAAPPAADPARSSSDSWAAATAGTDDRPGWAAPKPSTPADTLRPTAADPGSPRSEGAPGPSGTAPDGSWSEPVAGAAPEEPAHSEPTAAGTAHVPAETDRPAGTGPSGFGSTGSGGPSAPSTGSGGPAGFGSTGSGGPSAPGEHAGAGGPGESSGSAGEETGPGEPAGSGRWAGSWRWGNSEWRSDSARPGWSGRPRTGGPDWDTTRESVREMRDSAQRFAAQAADAARDPQLRDSAQRAVRSLGDAIATTAQDVATEIRERVRSPRWSDSSQPRPTERPPVAPVDDDAPKP